MNLELLPLTGMTRYPFNNEFHEAYKNRREGNFTPDIPVGYEKTKIIHVANGINRKIPAILNVFRYHVVDDDRDHTKNGLTRGDLGKIITGVYYNHSFYHNQTVD